MQYYEEFSNYNYNKIESLNQNSKTMKQTIWLVIEIGTGIIYKAFTKYSSALEYINKLKLETDLECYELHEIELDN